MWDAYNKDFQRIEGISLIRGETIPPGLFHLVCDILVQHIDGDYLLMQRDTQKPFGGMWEATAGGSALQGETPGECAVRELNEETGIAPVRLEEVGRVVSEEDRSLYVEFFCRIDCAKDSIVLQERETISYKWICKADLICMDQSELVTNRIQKFIPDLQI